MNEKFLACMLSNTCPKIRDKVDPNISLFVFDLHCHEMWVVAKVSANADEEYVYEVLGYKLMLGQDDMLCWARGFAEFKET